MNNYAWTIAAILSLGAIYIIYKFFETTGESQYIEDEKMKSSDTVAQDSSAWDPVSFPIKYGMMGEKVKTVQKYINNSLGKSIAVDARFGSETKNALESTLDVSQVDEELYNTMKGFS
jgi:peptidoglycan hydrolase-like protein with peptidoglycan-binding domain